jgi:hypothetical protein
MAVADTSIAAWVSISNSGFLGNRQLIAYDLIYKHGPITQWELDLLFEATNPNNTKDRTLSKRVSELEKMELVRRCGKKDHGNHETYLFETTTTILLVPYEKPMTARQSCKALREYIGDAATIFGSDAAPVEEITDLILAEMNRLGI